jgi:hypothetical protein
LCTPGKTSRSVTHSEIAPGQARLTPKFFAGGLPEKKVYLDGMSILSILLSLEAGCHKHLKSLYIRGHINGKLISKMLIDGDATVNLMSYVMFKKIGREDNELVNTNMTLNGVGGNPMEARGVISMELTTGSKSLVVAFFITEVQGNYSIILGRDWIHVNHSIFRTRGDDQKGGEWEPIKIPH